jgi:hypothetical protein
MIQSVIDLRGRDAPFSLPLWRRRFDANLPRRLRPSVWLEFRPKIKTFWCFPDLFTYWDS